jgi:hypothetical protein
MRKNEAKQSEMKRKFCLFVPQTEAKIMRSGLRFASISHEAKKIQAKKGHPNSHLYILSFALLFCIVNL